MARTLSHHRAHLPHSLSSRTTCRHADGASLPRYAPETIQGRAAHRTSISSFIFPRHTSTPAQSTPPSTTQGLSAGCQPSSEFQVKAILKRRRREVGDKTVEELPLIKWRDRGNHDNLWMPGEDIDRTLLTNFSRLPKELQYCKGKGCSSLLPSRTFQACQMFPLHQPDASIHEMLHIRITVCFSTVVHRDLICFLNLTWLP